MDAIRRDVAKLRERYKVLQQQQFTFINALANTRTDAYEKTKPVRSINHVKELFERSRNATDRRAMKQWLDLVGELTNIVMRISNVNPDVIKEGPANQAMARGRTLLNPSNEFSSLRAGYPHQEVNHLSCSEARVLYGGCVSIVPLVLDNLLKVYSVIKENGKELKETWPPAQTQRPRSIQSARHQRSKTETQAPSRAKTAVGTRNARDICEKSTDTKDLTKRMLKLSFGKMPKGHDENTLFYRRTLNGRADKLHINGEITLDKGPWRGGSYDKTNHVDHRRFVNLEDKFY
ncbi:sperm acrosome-associated protein 9 [Strongylocentrotus purpuratus]|uniref:Uncharacterized protein n=1 Tax=Strongylocentrotus purpuratus TaxID=7668 RepID=A0A7M7PP16_STRPU|nr:sperm acrosome-associated protein 9 [Strongylocentrotus purpuratus]|eukprot:XP_795420.1 PREDICTED: uncharacterized protein C9orf9 homolog [Strongylocentrotus purpuratus]